VQHEEGDVTDWREVTVANERTHHVRAGKPIYAARFEEVLSFHEPGLAAVRLGTQGWHITPDGLPAYERRFMRTFGFYEGRAAVVGAEGSHHVLADGRDLYPTRHAWCGNFQGGRCVVCELEGGYKHICLDGSDAYSARWRYAGDFREGTAVVMNADGLSTHIDAAGTLVHGRWLLDLDVFHKGLARARDARGWMHVDRSGKPIYEARFEAVEAFYNGRARAALNDEPVVIREDGSVLV
jgi:hypothetical protein